MYICKCYAAIIFIITMGFDVWIAINLIDFIPHYFTRVINWIF